jgi:hypothetical protein
MRTGEDYGFHLRTCQAGPVAFADVSSIRYRLGRSDQLGRPEHSMDIARNFLRTIESVIARDRERLRLPEWMLESVQAEAHAWVGREALAAGDRRAARRHLTESLRHRPLAPSTLLLLALTGGPAATCPVTRRAVRSVKRVLGRP